MIPKILTIAGSDPSGGAGIQADLKTFSALGAYGMSAITALTAQNTQGVSGVYEIPSAFAAAQIRAVFEDIDVSAVKIGMLGGVESVEAIAGLLQEFAPKHIVLDPVMVAGSGDSLISGETMEALKAHLIPLASVLPPNLPEAVALLARSCVGDMEEMAQELLCLGPRAVLLKGGHLGGKTSPDILAYEDKTMVLNEKRIQTNNTHGTGCTLSSALAVYLAKGLDLPGAAQAAKDYLTGALSQADDLDIGKGSGPVHHFYDLWKL